METRPQVKVNSYLKDNNDEEDVIKPSTHRSHHNSIVKLNIGGFKYETTEDTLCSIGETYFSSLLSKRIPSTQDDNGYYFIDRDGQYFGPILEYLRTGEMVLPPNIRIKSVKREAKFYSIPIIIGKKLKKLRDDGMYNVDGRFCMFIMNSSNNNNNNNNNNNYSNGFGVTSSEEKYSWKKNELLVTVTFGTERMKKFLLLEGKCPRFHKFHLWPLHGYVGSVTVSWGDKSSPIAFSGQLVEFIFDENFVYCYNDDASIQMVSYQEKTREYFKILSFELVVMNLTATLEVIPLDDILIVRTGDSSTTFYLRK